MSCPQCSRARILPVATTSLTIGSISGADTEVHVYFTRLSTRRTQRLSATSGNSGLVTVDVSSLSEFFRPGSDYELWLSLGNTTDIQQKQSITIGIDTAECLLLRFQLVEDETYTTQTIALED